MAAMATRIRTRGPIHIYVANHDDRCFFYNGWPNVDRAAAGTPLSDGNGILNRSRRDAADSARIRFRVELLDKEAAATLREQAAAAYDLGRLRNGLGYPATFCQWQL